jgi:hydantoinase/carbamoylase family amidase
VSEAQPSGYGRLDAARPRQERELDARKGNPLGGGRTLAADIEAAARFGATPSGGVDRQAWTAELARATEWVADELRRLELEVALDPAGNLIARWPAPDGPAVMVGSHLDTVPNGGAFDGTLGVLCAVDAVRRLRRERFAPRRPIWIAAFMDEEGARFGTALFGSRAFCGEDMTAALDRTDASGRSMREAIAAYGLDPDRLRDAAAVDAVGDYLELHIEQGPVLWHSGERLAVVESIAGVLGFLVHVHGTANHAGTTPMELRRDAVLGAARMVVALNEAAARDDGIRLTVGAVTARPGARNVIAGECSFTVDLRVARPHEFEARQAWLRRAVEQVAADGGLEVEVQRDYALEPATMDPAVVTTIEAAAREAGVEPVRMVSGAGHDAMVVARHARAGMLFVPSERGISHSPEERTAVGDCELGARALAGAIRRLAGPT